MTDLQEGESLSMESTTHTTGRYGRTIDLSPFAPEDRDAIIDAIQYAEAAAIIAWPIRYLSNDELSPDGKAHTLVALRERHDMGVTPDPERWYAVLDVDTRTTYNGDTLLQAWRKARAHG